MFRPRDGRTLKQYPLREPEKVNKTKKKMGLITSKVRLCVQ